MSKGGDASFEQVEVHGQEPFMAIPAIVVALVLVVECPSASVIKVEAQEVSILAKSFLGKAGLLEGQVEGLQITSLRSSAAQKAVEISDPNSHLRTNTETSRETLALVLPLKGAYWYWPIWEHSVMLINR